MTRTILISFVFVLLNISSGNCAFFYADALEQTIQEEFSEELQSLVASEYEAQMDAAGNIDVAGMEQVCYAGGYDVSTEEGAEKCQKFVKKVSSKCVYTRGSGLRYYNNPQNDDEKIKKCVFDKTMDYVFNWEKGFQQTAKDSGNRICDSKGNALKDKNGNFLLGATNLGITTCASGLSVNCVKNITRPLARQYYWTRFYRKYGYYKLPVEAIAAVMELAVGGTGTVASELKSVLGTNCNASNVINDCLANTTKEYIERNGVNDFYEKITQLRANKRSGKAKERALGVMELVNLHTQCANELGITFMKEQENATTSLKEQE